MAKNKGGIIYNAPWFVNVALGAVVVLNRPSGQDGIVIEAVHPWMRPETTSLLDADDDRCDVRYVVMTPFGAVLRRAEEFWVLQP